MIVAVIVAVLVLAVAAAAATWIGAVRQRRGLHAAADRLVSAAMRHPQTLAPDEKALAGLPAPVARYLRLVVPDLTVIEEVRIAQVGTLRTDAAADRWMTFAAEHLVVPAASGFLWNARVQVAPLLHVRVRDSLIQGTGAGQVSLMSAFTVSAAAGGPEMNAGSLHRYLAEAVWYPTALLPSRTLTWTPIDDRSALATLSVHGVSVALEFRFADTGEVIGIFTPARWGTFPDGYRQVPWEGHFRDYRVWDGVLLPTHGEVGWYIDGDWRAVWIGTVTGYRARIRVPWRIRPDAAKWPRRVLPPA